MKSSQLESVVLATERYHEWLLDYLSDAGDEEALEVKRHLMAKDVFPFLRGAFYRWVQRWEAEAGDLADERTPRVLSVGDLHVENYGTWRDEEGRMVWGINDFDEACELAWTSDLVRLATSALLGWKRLEGKAMCRQILFGYRDQMKADDARPFILAEDNRRLKSLMARSVEKSASGSKREARKHQPPTDAAAKFWKEFREKKTEVTKDVLDDARAILKEVLPKGAIAVEWRKRHSGVKPAGLGSIGRRRFYAVALWNGAWIAREAKALAPSALAWVNGTSSKILIGRLLKDAVRSPDPWLSFRQRWMVRRLAPDAQKLELSSLGVGRLEPDLRGKLFKSMGADVANIHRGSLRKAVLHDLERRQAKNRNWLFDAARKWCDKMNDDFAEFVKG